MYYILYILSLLPMRVLYFISDSIYGLVYRVMGYRKKVVLQNLKIVFPQKTEKERRRIARQFYHNLIDTFVETIKMISASDAFLQKRFKGNWDIVNEQYSSGRSIQILMGHTFNWEWGNYVAGTKFIYKFLAVYMPVKNKSLDRLFLKLRSRTGTVLLPATPTEDFRKTFAQYKGDQYLLGLAADQSPGNPKNAFWLNFFGRPTGFITGPERGARLSNLPVYFCYIHKPRRGYYEVVFRLEEENPAQLAEGELTLRFARYLEEVITKHPSMWLWSHRRWKKEWKEEYLQFWVDKERPTIEMAGQH